ncbi:MAG: ammonium transporter, partial [Brotaphodocola sp.]
IMKNLMDFCIGAPLFWFLGFGIMYGAGSAVFGTVDFFSLGNYTMTAPQGIPKDAFLIFQTVFCATSATIVSGAMAGRTRFPAYCLASAVISAIIYPVAGHWIWGGGWLQQLGFHDLAGSCAVHIVGGTAAFCGAKALGPRIGKYGKNGKSRAIPGHSITLGALGIFILWFSWFGFNGTSLVFVEDERVLELTARAFLNTNLSAALSAVTAMMFTWIRYKKPDVSMTLNSALAGLVAITAGCDVMSPFGAALTGICAGFICVLTIEWIDQKQKVDDPVGAVGVHGCCGVLGTIFVGLLHTEKGLFYGGGFAQLGIQIAGCAAVILWVGVTMTLTLKAVGRTVGLRVPAREEIDGLDSTEHNLANAYADFLPSIDPVTLHVKSGDQSLVKKDIPVEEAIPIAVGQSADHPSVLSKVEIITKKEKFEELKDALNEIGVTGMTVTAVTGCGVQKGAAEFYRGSEVELKLLPKIRIEVIVAKVPVEEVVRTARKVLYTGHIGDGKIFVYDVRDAVKVRTGETGYDAMQGVNDLTE